MKYEYKTTRSVKDSSDIDPIQPEGDNWEFCGMAITPDYKSFYTNSIFYWAWRRVVKKTRAKKSV